MLREGLRAELPEAFALAARVRRMRPSIGAMPWWLATFAAMGAQWLVLAVVRGSLVLALNLVPAVTFSIAEATELAAVTVAVVVAKVSGGWRAFIAFALVSAFTEVAQLLISLPGRVEFCAHAPALPSCTSDPALSLALRSWPIAIGFALGPIAAALFRRGVGTSALLVGASAAAIAPYSATGLTLPFIAVRAQGDEARQAFEIVIGAHLLAALIFGLIAGRLGRRHLLDGTVIACAYALPWLHSLVMYWRDRDPRLPFLPLVVPSSYLPMLFAGVALLGLVVGAWSRAAIARERSLPPDASASRRARR